MQAVANPGLLSQPCVSPPCVRCVLWTVAMQTLWMDGASAFLGLGLFCSFEFF